MLLEVSRGHQNVLAHPTLVLLQVLLEGLAHKQGIDLQRKHAEQRTAYNGLKRREASIGSRVVLMGPNR